ncbi:Sip1-related alpha-galactosidase [Saccharicrinis sp. GN24d3]|uniref:Sip1-related alpha-galactosidase n=1 Tax=Saccharicrinis sp. GN24d3 TaxID=3458416 RepID=UPI0040355D6B
MKLITILGCVFLMLSCNVEKNDSVHCLDSVPEVLTLSELDGDGVFSLAKQQLTPVDGIIAEISLALPKYKKGIYYRPFSSTLASGNRLEPLWFEDIAELDTFVRKAPRMDDDTDMGAFMMLQKPDGKYLVLLPLVSSRVGNTFTIKNKKLYLTMATYGTDREDLAVPLISYAQSENPYEAARLAWANAMNLEGIKGNINWRENKSYPEAYQYLGWCSWEHYRQNINETIILNGVDQIKASDIPFRWVLIDDGYLDHKSNKLLSFGVDKKKFPNGWETITSQKDDKIKWMGIWRCFSGYFGGVSPEHTMTALQDHLVERSAGKNKSRMMPKISPESANAFYNAMTANTQENGFDLIKVDFQSDNFRYNTGASNAILGVHYNNTALEENCKEKGLKLLNCIAMQNFNVFNHRYSSLIRGSVDYKINRDRLDVTLVQNFTNAFWLGHTHWLDQDMFFANHKASNRLMAVARAISGGPIYLSDEPQDIDDTVLKPLTFADGHILGTLAPGVPLPESLMQDPYYEGKAFRLIAPLENNSAVIMTVNLNQDGKAIDAFVSADDYYFAGGMMQPYEGLWKLPEEGILLYDYYGARAQILKEDVQFSLASREERLFQLSPVKAGWAVIGRPDKYLPAATFTMLEISEDKVKVKMKEDGPVLLWSQNKIPESSSFSFKKLENGLWQGDLIQANEKKEYTINAKL